MLSLHTVVYQQQAFLFHEFYLGSREVVGKMFVLPGLSFYYLPHCFCSWTRVSFFLICYVTFFDEISIVKPCCICTPPCVAVGQLITGLVLSPGKRCSCVTLCCRCYFTVVHGLISIGYKNRDRFPVLCPLQVHLLWFTSLLPCRTTVACPIQQSNASLPGFTAFCAGKRAAFSSGYLGAF